MKKFIIFGIISEIIYLLFFGIIYLRNNIYPESLNEGEDIINNIIIYLSFTSLLLVLLFIYIKIHKIIKLHNIRFKIIFLFATLFSVTLFVMHPFPSYDTYTYINQSRKVSDFEQNPYLHNKNVFNNDDWKNVKMTSWSTHPSVYGPGFIYFGSIITTLSQKNFTFAIYLFKLSFLIIHLLLTYLLYKAFGKIAAFLYSWNPLILFEFILNGHNDILVIFLISLSLLVLHKNTKILKLILSWLILFLSVFIKYTTIIYLPIFFISLYFLNVEKKDKTKFLILSTILSVALVFLLYYSFWAGPNTFLQIKNYTYGQFSIFASPLITLTASIIYFISSSTSFYTILQWSQNICLVVFLLLYSYLFFDIIKNRKILNYNKLLKTLSVITIIFFLLAVNWLMPWYFPQLIIFALLLFVITKKEKYLSLIQGVTLYGLLYNIFLR